MNNTQHPQPKQNSLYLSHEGYRQAQTNAILCSCGSGQPATSTLVGKHTIITRCTNCETQRMGITCHQ